MLDGLKKLIQNSFGTHFKKSCKMSTPYEYMKYVVGGGHYRLGMISANNIFKKNDHPNKWDMRKFVISNSHCWWDVGYIHRGQLAYQRDSADAEFTPSYFFPRITPAEQYWWCRDGDWMPHWGNATKQRAELMKELRSHWMNKWFGETIPIIKNTIKETTNLPEDIITELPTYFEYPYQKKRLDSY